MTETSSKLNFELTRKQARIIAWLLLERKNIELAKHKASDNIDVCNFLHETMIQPLNDAIYKFREFAADPLTHEGAAMLELMKDGASMYTWVACGKAEAIVCSLKEHMYKLDDKQRVFNDTILHQLDCDWRIELLPNNSQDSYELPYVITMKGCKDLEDFKKQPSLFNYNPTSTWRS